MICGMFINIVERSVKKMLFYPLAEFMFPKLNSPIEFEQHYKSFSPLALMISFCHLCSIFLPLLFLLNWNQVYDPGFNAINVCCKLFRPNGLAYTHWFVCKNLGTYSQISNALTLRESYHFNLFVRNTPPYVCAFLIPIKHRLRKKILSWL